MTFRFPLYLRYFVYDSLSFGKVCERIEWTMAPTTEHLSSRNLLAIAKVNESAHSACCQHSFKFMHFLALHIKRPIRVDKEIRF